MNNEALRKEIYEELHSQYESKIRNAKKQKSQLEEELESASEKWRTERRRLNSEIDRLETALEDNRDAHRKTGDTRNPRPETQDIAKLQAAGDERLRNATEEWDVERAKLEGEISRLQHGVAELLERANNPIRAGQAAREHIERERRENASARETLEHDLQKAQKEIELSKGAQSGDLERQAVQLEESRKAHTKIQDLERRIAVAKEAAGKEAAALLEKQIAESARTRQSLERELQKAQQEAVQLKEKQAEELRIVMTRLEASQTEIQQLGRQLESTSDAVCAEVVEQLRRQYDERLQEMILEKTQLSEHLNNASALLEAERSRFAAAAAAQSAAKPARETASGPTIDRDALDAELARVEALIDDISKLIDDPSTELSFVIRKNVERAGLDAYLKGILFSLGRSQRL